MIWLCCDNWIGRWAGGGQTTINRARFNRQQSGVITAKLLREASFSSICFPQKFHRVCPRRTKKKKKIPDTLRGPMKKTMTVTLRKRTEGNRHAPHVDK